MASRVHPRFYFSLVVATFIITASPLHSEYREPNMEKALFEQKQIKLDAFSEAGLVGALVSVARDFDESGNGVTYDTRAYALAIAGRISPDSKRVNSCLRELATKGETSKIEADLERSADRLFSGIRSLMRRKDNKANQICAAYCIDIAILIETRSERLEQLKKYQEELKGSGFVVTWAGMLLSADHKTQTLQPNSKLNGATANFLFLGGNLRAGSNWRNVVNKTTGNLPTKGDHAVINVNGFLAHQLAGDLAGATITQTSGIISANNFNWNDTLETKSVYNLQGGQLNAKGNFNMQSATFNISGGVFTFNQELILNGAQGSINISGNAVIKATDDFDIFFTNDDATFNIASDWTGKFTSTVNKTVADWIFELVDGVGDDDDGTDDKQDRFISVGGTRITSANFKDFFVIKNTGGVSTLRLKP